MTGVVAALVATVLGMIYASSASLGAFDEVEPGQEGIHPPLRYLALAIDFGGEPVGAAILITAVVGVCLVLRRQRLAVLALLGSGLTVTMTTLLKPVVHRPIHRHFLSYPSGHTALFTSLAFVLALIAVGRLRTSAPTSTLLVLAAAGASGAAMAWAQVSLGAHYPTDTVGGFCIAIAIMPATAWLLDRAADRRRPSYEAWAAHHSQ